MPGQLAAVAVGFASGVLSGMFGIGGGLITTPAIRLLLGYAELVAVGTPLPVILPGAITGALAYYRRGSADVRAGVTMGVVGAAGSVAGAVLSSRLGGTIVLLATAALIVWAAADMLLQERAARRVARSAAPDADAAVGEAESDEALVSEIAPPHGRISTWRLVAIGLAAGLYSGLLGLGGGFIIVPGLTRYCGVPVKRAIGTSLITVAVLAIPGSIAHSALGHIDWGLAALLAIGVVPGAALGARLTRRASDSALRLAFAALLVVVGAWLAINEFPALHL